MPCSVPPPHTHTLLDLTLQIYKWHGTFWYSYDTVMGIYVYTNVKCCVLWTATSSETFLSISSCLHMILEIQDIFGRVLFIQDMNKWCLIWVHFWVLSADILACHAWHKQKRLSTEALPCFSLRPTFALTEMCFVTCLLCTPLHSVTSPS